ncbi:hypothetical protein G8E05_06600 [Clostridium botulinum]|uniref:hypothetical protein n=1 Tax=Clostridium botulinum TaxID=1491 RepID=UPI00035B9FF3|nr:hypothetical protein [Clostridium botulinum]EPS52855.1 hypothetical protein CFSAN002368_03619 [Clostridium botulinum A1 str. CFSAN002368]MBY6893231.1 hypothetical protein [Clostridium botulinum]MBY6894502.1 hypothetical protein [Clostridium botulinum]MBY6901606.1 hypothetical protein [Clostridium botulinum]UOJ20710.1 hypothetical protein G8E05_06600 [Clostridium botulinum]
MKIVLKRINPTNAAIKIILYLLMSLPKFEKIFSVTFILPKKAITIPENIPNIDINCALEF